MCKVLVFPFHHHCLGVSDSLDMKCHALPNQFHVLYTKQSLRLDDELELTFWPFMMRLNFCMEAVATIRQLWSEMDEL